MASIKDQLRTNLRTDGEDHLNISAYAETELGKITSPDWRKKFYVPHIGDFVSARAFANWLVSGGSEDLRHNTKFYKTSVPVEDFRKLVVFAKYYQLCSLRSSLVTEQALLSLPWVMYKRHFSGVREFDRWTHYTAEIKPMVHDIISDTSRGRYNWMDKAPDHLGCVNHYLAQIAGPDFIAFENLDQVSRERNAERTKASAERRKQVEQVPTASAEVIPFKPPVAPVVVSPPDVGEMVSDKLSSHTDTSSVVTD